MFHIIFLISVQIVQFTIAQHSNSASLDLFWHSCGLRPLEENLNGRIVGGRETSIGEVPFQVMIKEHKMWGLFKYRKCGGVLITHNWILTAAHCQRGWFASLEVVLGEIETSKSPSSQNKSKTERNKKVSKVKQIIIHPEFNQYTFENDIALIELADPVEFNDNVQPICLPGPEEDDLFYGKMGTVSGWGRLASGRRELPAKLHVAQVPILRNDKCEQMFSLAGYRRKIPASALCAGFPEGGKDSCEGDSGGPLMVNIEGFWSLVGIVSHGIKCAEPNLPGVYTRVSFYLDWIKNILHQSIADQLEITK